MPGVYNWWGWSRRGATGDFGLQWSVGGSGGVAYLIAKFRLRDTWEEEEKNVREKQTSLSWGRVWLGYCLV